MSKMLRALALVVLVCTSSACSENGSDKVSENTNTTSASADGASTSGTLALDKHQKAVKFAACIRSNGVKDFPDPNEKDEFTFGINVTPAVWTKAVDACKDLQPEGFANMDRTPEQQKSGIEFANCIREHGVKDFPDPIQGEPLVNTYRIPSSNTQSGMNTLNAAMNACRSAMTKAAAGQ
jgi:hypothetical protein